MSYYRVTNNLLSPPANSAIQITIWMKSPLSHPYTSLQPPFIQGIISQQFSLNIYNKKGVTLYSSMILYCLIIDLNRTKLKSVQLGRLLQLPFFAKLRQSSSYSWPELSLIFSVSHPPTTHPTGKVLNRLADCCSSATADWVSKPRW